MILVAERPPSRRTVSQAGKWRPGCDLGLAAWTMDIGVAIFPTHDTIGPAAAADLGVSAVQIMRGELDGKVAWDAEVVRSLRDVEAMLLTSWFL